MCADQNIIGVVTPIKWDDWKVLGISIATQDEEEYIVDMEYGEGEELLNYINALVNVNGRTFYDSVDDEKKYITIKNYEVLSEDEL